MIDRITCQDEIYFSKKKRYVARSERIEEKKVLSAQSAAPL